MRGKLIALLFEEIERQVQEDGGWFGNQFFASDGKVGVDSEVDLGKIADRILELVGEYRAA